MNPMQLLMMQQKMMADGSRRSAQSLPSSGAPMPSPSPAPSPDERPNPLELGTMSGLQAARQSYGMDENQRRNAMADAAATLTGNIYSDWRNGSGLNGLLGGIRQGLSPAIKEYLAHKRHYEQENRAEHYHQQKFAHEVARDNREAHRLENDERRINAQIERQNTMENRQLQHENRTADDTIRAQLYKIQAEKADIKMGESRYIADQMKARLGWADSRSKLAYILSQEYKALVRPELARLDKQIRHLSKSVYSADSHAAPDVHEGVAPDVGDEGGYDEPVPPETHINPARVEQLASSTNPDDLIKMIKAKEGK